MLMKKKILVIPLILGALISIIELLYWADNKDPLEIVSCKCIKKYEEKDDVNVYSFMVLKTCEEGKVFKLHVTPETYYAHNVGDKLTFKLRRSGFDSDYEWIAKLTILLIIGIIGFTAIISLILTDNFN